MTRRTAAIYGFCGAVLVACLAAANMPSHDSDVPRARPMHAAPASGPDAIAVDVRSQAARLHARLTQAPVPDANPRNPFAFGAPPRAARSENGVVRAAVAPDPPPAVFTPPPPPLVLIGIAEETLPGGPRRTAIITLRQAQGEGDNLYMVTEGQSVGDRYRVRKIGADAVELEDLTTHAYRRLAIQ